MGGSPSQARKSSGREIRSTTRAEEPEVRADTEEEMTASTHLEPGLLLLLLPLACWQTPGMVGASESVSVVLKKELD